MSFQFTVVPLILACRSGSIGPLWRQREVTDMVEEARRIWLQYSVDVRMREIAERTINMPSAVDGISRSELPGLPGVLEVRGAVVVLVHRLTGNTNAGLAVVGGRICALQWPLSGRVQAINMGRILAHELGHIFGLDDYQNPEYQPGRHDEYTVALSVARSNLMTSSIDLGTQLTPDQVTRAQSSPWLSR
ncbi:MAG: hypothetical protein AB1499_04635 [Nitrospirota bacterium]